MKISNFKTLALLASVIFIWVLNSSPAYSVQCSTGEKYRLYINTKNHNKILLDSSDNPDLNQKLVYISPSGFFKIHYDTTGDKAVSLTDANKNGIPDWIDSIAYYADYCRSFYVNTLHYKDYITDQDSSGNFYNIFVTQLDGTGYYGGTQPLPDNHSYLLIDNDYSANDGVVDTTTGKKNQTYSTTSYSALKVTMAHEMFHGIQFSHYGMNSNLIYEMTATAMEMRVFPEIPDYMQYVRKLFKNYSTITFGSGDNNNGYYFCTFADYLRLNYGDSLLRRMWEINPNTDKCNTYFALDNALRERNSCLDSAWMSYLPYLYFSGERAKAGYFNYASQMPTFGFNETIDFDSPLSSTSKALMPYEIAPYRTVFLSNELARSNDTIDIIATNLNLDLAMSYNNGSETRKNAFAFYTTNQDDGDINTKKIGSTEYFYNYESGSDKTINALIYIYEGMNTTAADYAFPNPVRLSTDKTIYLPADAESPIYQKKINEVTILDIDGTTIYDSNPKIVQVIPYEGKRVIAIGVDELPSNLKSGVYLYSIKYDGNTKIGKLAIRK